MKHAPPPWVLRTLLLLLFAAVAGCSRNPVATVVNRTDKTLSYVVLSGAGFSEQISSINPGEKITIAIHPTAATPLRVGFKVNWKFFDSGAHGYFEPDQACRISVIIEPDLRVSVYSE